MQAKRAADDSLPVAYVPTLSLFCPDTNGIPSVSGCKAYVEAPGQHHIASRDFSFGTHVAQLHSFFPDASQNNPCLLK
ncbi:MAG: hypothetical protein NTX46_03050 [Chloroflexi bacterium]|nr:hypothetical protein [Chloroflexota bacterium]